MADHLKTVIANPDRGQDDASWEKRVHVWRDPRVVVGASDAGAHLDMIDSFSYATTLLARAVRERSLLPIAEAVHLLTDRPARLYGLRHRARIAEGWWAGLVVLDPPRSVLGLCAPATTSLAVRGASTAKPKESTT